MSQKAIQMFRQVDASLLKAVARVNADIRNHVPNNLMVQDIETNENPHPPVRNFRFVMFQFQTFMSQGKWVVVAEVEIEYEPEPAKPDKPKHEYAIKTPLGDVYIKSDTVLPAGEYKAEIVPLPLPPGNYTLQADAYKAATEQMFGIKKD